jgi:hypothetical protein
MAGSFAVVITDPYPECPGTVTKVGFPTRWCAEEWMRLELAAGIELGFVGQTGKVVAVADAPNRRHQCPGCSD